MLTTPEAVGDRSSSIHWSATDDRVNAAAYVWRACAAISFRARTSATSVSIDDVHSASVAGRKPLTPGAMTSQFMPTGVATAGRPAEKYWMILNAHLPSTNGSRDSGMIPMSDSSSHEASRSRRHSRCSISSVSEMMSWMS